MDLIPIIEYTLLIFIGLLLVVILSSYLIFMLRKNRSTGSDEPEQNSLREYRQYEPEVQYLIPVNNEEEIAYDEQEYRKLNTYSTKQKTSSRFTVLNPGTSSDPVYSHERVNSFDHRFAPTKSKDAFAMFR